MYFALYGDGRIWAYVKLEKSDKVQRGYAGYELMFTEVWFTVNHGRVHTERGVHGRQRLRDLCKKWGGVEISKDEYIRAVLKYVKTKE